MPTPASRDEIRRARAMAEMEKRAEFGSLVLDIPADVASYDQAILVVNHMAKVAAEKLFPDERVNDA